MPPALATKSGAHRIPRSISCSATSSEASWLLAAPAIARQRSAGTELGVEHGAERARRQHVDVRADGGLGIGPLRAELLGEPALALVDVRDHEPRPGGGEAAGERAADAAEPDDRDRAPVEVERAPDALAGHADRLLDAERGPRAGVAGASALDGEAGHVGGALRDHRHVGVGGPDVLGGPVAPAEDVDGVAEVQQRGAAQLALQRRLAERAHDHALAAALRQVRDRGLEGHRARQAQRVGDGVARVGVAPHAAAAERRPARGRVHGDDRVQPRATAAADEQLLVLEGLQVAVDGSEASGCARRRPAAARAPRCPRTARPRAARRARWSRARRPGPRSGRGAGSVSAGATGVAASGSSGGSETVGSSGAVTPPVSGSVSSGATAPPRSGS